MSKITPTSAPCAIEGQSTKVLPLPEELAALCTPSQFPLNLLNNSLFRLFYSTLYVEYKAPMFRVFLDYKVGTTAQGLPVFYDLGTDGTLNALHLVSGPTCNESGAYYSALPAPRPYVFGLHVLQLKPQTLYVAEQEKDALFFAISQKPCIAVGAGNTLHASYMQSMLNRGILEIVVLTDTPETWAPVLSQFSEKQVRTLSLTEYKKATAAALICPEQTFRQTLECPIRYRQAARSLLRMYTYSLNTYISREK